MPQIESAERRVFLIESKPGSPEIINEDCLSLYRHASGCSNKQLIREEDEL